MHKVIVQAMQTFFCLDMNVKFAPTEQLQESEAASATGAESTQHAPQFGY